MPNKTINVAVIGCGHWGKNLVRNFSELGALQSVCDNNAALANEIAVKYAVPVKNLEETLTSDIDGVVIAAPAALHYELSKRALLAGKHVFVEKPLSLDTAQGHELCELAKSTKKILMVGHLLQYHSAFLTLKQYVRDGKLGKLHYIYSNRLNLGKFRNEENILWSFAPHDISMILSLAGNMPQSVYAAGSAHLNKHIQDVTTTHLAFANGVQAHVYVSWLHPFKEQKLVVIGNKGMMVFDDGLDWSEKLKLYPHQVSWVNGQPTPEKADHTCIPLEPQEPLKAECQHFLDAITLNTTPRTDGVEGLNVLTVLDAAQKSLQSGKNISLDAGADKNYFKHESAIIDDGCDIGKNTQIWHFSHILKDTKIGTDCTIGQNVMIGPNVTVGNTCKIQNNVSLYQGVTLEDGVFCGPSCVFTNVHNPRAEVSRKDEFRQTRVEKGVTIGANATIICGNRLGAYSLIGAGAVITKDVKPFAVMAGNPAIQIGWVSHAGEKLDETLICPREGRRYTISSDGTLEEVVENDQCITETA